MPVAQVVLPNYAQTNDVTNSWLFWESTSSSYDSSIQKTARKGKLIVPETRK